MTLFETLANLEESDDLHVARLLILLGTFVGKNNKGSIEGLTKLAKLDFLLRYPVYLERALKARHDERPTDNIKPEVEADVQDHERISVESSMLRFKFGPWDHRYRRFLNILVGRGLAVVVSEGRTYHIGLTDGGLRKAQELSATPENSDMFNRTKVIKRHFDVGGTALKDFIYRTFPEIVSLRFGEEIRHEN